MGKIIIFSDDSFEAVAAAKPKDLKGHQERVKELKKDVSIATKIASQNEKLDTLKETLAKLKGNGTRRAVTPQATKARIETVRGKIKTVREIIKALKGELSTPLNAKLERAKEQLSKAQMAKADHSKPHLPRSQKTPRAGDSAKVKRNEGAAYDRERKELMTRFNQLGRAVEAAKQKVKHARTPEAKDKAAKELKALEKSYNSTRIALTKMKPSAAQRAKDEAANERSKKAATRVHYKQVDSDKRKAAEYGRDVKLGLRDSR